MQIRGYTYSLASSCRKTIMHYTSVPLLCITHQYYVQEDYYALHISTLCIAHQYYYAFYISTLCIAHQYYYALHISTLCIAHQYYYVLYISTARTCCKESSRQYSALLCITHQYLLQGIQPPVLCTIMYYTSVPAARNPAASILHYYVLHISTCCKESSRQYSASWYSCERDIV
jgi:hypothetical protein